MKKSLPCERQCQSCGMPFDQDSEKGGTEKDGSKSTMYCSLCYKDGKFCRPDATVKGMQELVWEKMKEKGFRRPMRMMAWYQIPRLKRWK
ncbi:MAG TPA: zinc ribbon domain-containing protein [Candidatus Absconditabacterales bacterium]|nr:zinc ribbon domain-containing protein [Candidatus Absconditabacterales bacterium]